MLLNNRNIVAFIPVRGGSKSIPLKNIKEFLGKPLVYWTAKAASDCTYINKVYISTDSDLIESTIQKLSFPSKVSVVRRSDETATDTASTESAMLEFINGCDCTDVVLIQATSPLLESEDLDGGIRKYLEGKYDSLLSVVPQRRFIWEYNKDIYIPNNYDPINRPRRQDLTDYYVENGAFYITGKENLLKSNSRLSGRIGAYHMPEYTYFEIDEKEDWLISEQIKAQISRNNGYSKKKINLFITDVDGTLTDGGMYYIDNGSEGKKFNTRDGKGIALLRNQQIKVMILTSEQNSLIKDRADKLHVDYCIQGVDNKEAFLNDFINKHPEYSWDTIAYIGDDVNDLCCLKKVAISAAPYDAMRIVKKNVDYICTSMGGMGAVREFCEMILMNR